jgi:YD repeat-containing protein
MQSGKESVNVSSQRSVLSMRRLRSLCTHLTFPLLTRLVLTTLLLTGSVLASWSLLVPPAAAASLKAATAASSLQASTQNQQQLKTSHTAAQQASSSTSTSLSRMLEQKTTPNVSSSAPYDGLGQLPFYTFIKHPLTSSSCTCGGKTLYVNVANGNLLLHSVEEQVRGTGIDLSVESFYNSLANSSRDLGNNWNFSVGNDVRLDFSDPLGGIIYHGPSGYSAYFAKNSNGTFKDVPGLNATLVKNADGSYDMTFHQSSEKLHFGGSGHLQTLQDKNGNTISIAYDSSYDVVSYTDTQGRTTSLNHQTVAGFTDPGGEIIKIADPNGKVVTYSYDSNGNLTGITQPSPLGSETLTHDVLSRVTSVTDGKNQTTSYGYTNLNQIETVTYADGSTITYSYDQDNNLISQIDHAGTTSFTYDALNRMTSKTLPGGTTISYTYDKVGNLTTSTDAGGMVTYALSAILITLYIGADVSIFIYNNSIATYCGWPKISYLPTPFCAK